MLHQNLAHSSKSRLKLKPISLFFISAELLDILTTFGGLALHPQMWEANPVAGLLGGMVPAALFKVLVTLAVVYVIEKVASWPKLVWIVPVMASTPVVWNVISISAEFMNSAAGFLATFSALGGLK
jgi:hypothetical protein